MASSSQILANNMAQGGGVDAQLAMGRDRISLAQMQQQRQMEADRLSQAMQIAQMNQQMDQARMAQQQQQFMSGQDFDRAKMAQQDKQFGMGFGLDQSAADRSQMLFDYEQQQRERAELEKAAMGQIYGQMAEQEKLDGYAATPASIALDNAYKRGDIDDVMYNNLKTQGYDRYLDTEKVTGRSRGGAIDAAAQKIMAENPGMSYTEAYMLAQSGLRQARFYNPETGGIESMAGATDVMAAESAAEREQMVTDPNTGKLVSAAGLDESLAAREKLVKGEGQAGIEDAKIDAASPMAEAQRIAKAETAWKDFAGNMPAVLNAADRLYVLADAASYSKGQAIADATNRELSAFGLGDINDGAKAKAAYENIVRTEILPSRWG